VARGYAAVTSLPHQGLVIIAGGGGLFLVGISSGFVIEIALCLFVSVGARGGVDVLF
jgi:hypothetical protein